MLSWEYIAGFFDGEGCITRGKAGPNSFYLHRLAISQSQERGRLLLEELKVFLQDQGISSSVKIHTRANPVKNHKPCWVIEIRQRESTVKFLTQVFPYLHIKKVEAQDLLRYLKLYPKLTAQQVMKARA